MTKTLLALLFPVLAFGQLNIAGSWRITGTSSIFPVVSTATGTITQNGDSVSVQLTVTGTPCASSATGTGTLAGTLLTLNLNEGGQNVVFTGRFTSDGNSISGNYQAAQGGCTQGDFGTFFGTRLPVIGAGGVVNGASFGTLSPAAGSIGSLFGTNLASAVTAATSLPLPTTLGGVTVRINNIAVPLFFVAAGQINFQFPWELTGVTSPTVTVTARGVTSSAQTVGLAATGPGIFAINSQGTGQGAIQIANTVIFAAPDASIPGAQARPAKRGEFLTIYCTGLGDVDRRPANGAGSASNPVSNTRTAPTVTIGGVPATVSFSGLSPGFVALYQVNVQVPSNAPSGAAVQLIVTSGGVASNTVTIAVE